MTPERTSSFFLVAGQSLHLHVRRGSMIVAADGLLRVDFPPLWLAERMVSERIDVPEGATLTAPRSGWIAVSARSAGVTCILVETHWYLSLAGLLRMAVNHIRRRRQDIPPEAERGWSILRLARARATVPHDQR